MLSVMCTLITRTQPLLRTPHSDVTTRSSSTTTTELCASPDTPVLLLDSSALSGVSNTPKNETIVPPRAVRFSICNAALSPQVAKRVSQAFDRLPLTEQQLLARRASLSTTIGSLEVSPKGGTSILPPGSIHRFSHSDHRDSEGSSFDHSSSAHAYSVMNTSHANCNQSTTSSTDGPDAFSRVNQYLFLDELGRGAQGVVYLGFDDKKQVFRAIKEIKKPLATSAEMAQLKIEIEIMKRLRHRSIVPLYEVINDPKQKALYLVMQYMEKGPLVKFDDDMTSVCSTHHPALFIDIAKQLVSALKYLHSLGIYHRDIKPDNVLCGDDGRVYFTDFGVAHQIALPTDSEPTSMQSENTSSEQPDKMALSTLPQTRGTPAFLSPEVHSGRPEVTMDLAAADIWSLGVTFYLALVGHLPFGKSPKRKSSNRGEIDDDHKPDELSFSSFVSAGEYARSVVSDSVEFPPELPKEWADLIRKMLDKDPKTRTTIVSIRRMLKLMNPITMKCEDDTAQHLQDNCLPSPPHRTLAGSSEDNTPATSFRPKDDDDGRTADVKHVEIIAEAEPEFPSSSSSSDDGSDGGDNEQRKRIVSDSDISGGKKPMPPPKKEDSPSPRKADHTDKTTTTPATSPGGPHDRDHVEDSVSPTIKSTRNHNTASGSGAAGAAALSQKKASPSPSPQRETDESSHPTVEGSSSTNEGEGEVE